MGSPCFGKICKANDGKGIERMTPRERMVWEMQNSYGLDSPGVFGAMLQVPREEFAPKYSSEIAYEDLPIPIGYGQTMSQPYTVAFMTHLLRLSGKEKVLEIGTGSGYQAAILSLLARKVYTIEIIPELGRRARRILQKLGYNNVEIRLESGEKGWEQKAPFNAILVTAEIGERALPKLLDQIKSGGVLVAPVKKINGAVMTRFTKRKSKKIKKEEFGIFYFVPFVEKKS